MMNVLFISLMGFQSINDRDIYTDLLREFAKNGHKVYIVSPAERRLRVSTGLIKEPNSTILRVKTGNIQKTNIIEKGISTVLLERQVIKAIKKYFKDVKFDLVLYSTPPITIGKAVEYVKKRDNAKTYLMLKDIFPQNAVDIGMMIQSGLKGCIYKFFRRKEEKLYAISDYIGCMSQANVEYLLKINSRIDQNKVGISPNCVEVHDLSVDNNEKKQVREKYHIPQDKTVYLYGGNLGRPQGIEHMLKCIESEKSNDRVFFLIIGSGTEFEKIQSYLALSNQKNAVLFNRLPKEDYLKLIGSCDIGLLFLDHRFTIPNFPSRLVDYLQSKLPVIACTDPNTDVGKVIVDNGFGWWCESDSIEKFRFAIDLSLNSSIKEKGEVGYKYLCDNWDVKDQYLNILKSINDDIFE